MPEINQLNDYIKEKIKDGVYVIDVNLNDYTNTQIAEIINLPPELEQIKFLSDYNTEHRIRIVANEQRNKDLIITMNNVKINSESYSAIDIRGLLNQNYASTINYSGINDIQSKGMVAIYVNNDQIININGVTSDSQLNVFGGLGYSAIGNAPIDDYGGKIIFSGSGKVKAVGGNGALQGPKDGGFAIGFADDTKSPSSITIKCGPIVEAIGGNGQETDTNDTNSKGGGNGGAGISLGENGVLIVEECPKVDKSLIATGGNGGEVVSGLGAVQGEKKGGSGGDAVSIITGKVIIENGAELKGGDGTSLKDNQEELPVIGGNGGNGIDFVGDDTTNNTILIKSDVNITGGNGGNSGVNLAFDTDISIESFDGGNGGSAIQAADNKLDVILDSGVLISGSGGNGGSPSAFGDDNIKGVKGADFPGTGGNNGSVIDGISDGTVRKKTDVSIISGTPGYGGTGIGADGSKIVGETGAELKPITLRVIESLKFGYINLRTKLDLCKCAENTINGTLNTTRDFNKKKQCSLSIGQNFENCLNIELLNIQSYYDLSKPMSIYGKLFITLMVNSSINACEKTIIPMVVRRDEE